MYVDVNKLEATNDNVVLQIKKWPSSFLASKLVTTAENRYDNGRELYLGEVKSSANPYYESGDLVAVDIYFGSHVPSENRTEKIKIVPATGIVLKSKEFKVMSDIVNMEPGIDRIFVKLRRKESITAAGIHIPTEVLAQDPTAQDVRIADVLKSNASEIKAGEVVVLEAFTGKDVYLDSNKDLHVICYATDILGKINK